MTRADKIRVALFFIGVPLVIYLVAVLSGCVVSPSNRPPTSDANGPATVNTAG